MGEYREIQELFEYCRKAGIDAVLEKLYDGYKILFPNGGDVVQHYGSYGAENGCVEPAIGCRLDYSAVPLANAKRLVLRHRDRL